MTELFIVQMAMVIAATLFLFYITKREYDKKRAK
jgi:hypothetical protein